MSALVAFVHHLGAFTLVSALVLQKVLLRDVVAGNVDANVARHLRRADRIFGIAAAVVLAAGLLRVFVFEKGSGYYFHSVPFLLKASLFVIVGLLSIVPTIEFIGWGKAQKAGQAPAIDAAKLSRLQTVVQLELAGVMLLILCAALMAKGIGVFG